MPREALKPMRHERRMTQELLREEFAAGLHALELICRTPAEESRVK